MSTEQTVCLLFRHGTIHARESAIRLIACVFCAKKEYRCGKFSLPADLKVSLSGDVHVYDNDFTDSGVYNSFGDRPILMLSNTFMNSSRVNISIGTVLVMLEPVFELLSNFLDVNSITGVS